MQRRRSPAGTASGRGRRGLSSPTSPNPPDHGDDEVAAVDADECSRSSFLCVGSLAGLVVFLGSLLLLGFFPQPSQSTIGSVVYMAVRVLAVAGMVVGLCSASLFFELWERMDDGDKHAEVIIDRMM
ncbi:hypothetical protein D1007_29975 [Hordeum vulgare]|nr:hypothetical protein D1007_29975 [Hordeum vulgare]